MRRKGLALALAVTVAVLVGASAHGASPTVTANTDSAGNSFFEPAKVTIDVGDTVHWHNNGGNHNVHLGFNGKRIGGNPVTHQASTAPWDADWKFTSPGTFKYWCDYHSDGTYGMIGKVVVVDPNARAPKVSNLTAKPASFCTNRSQTCDHRGTKIKFTLSAAGKVTGQIKPKGTTKPFATIFKDVQKPAGKSSIKYSGKGLKPGKYLLRVRARGSNGRVSPFVKTTVKVVKNG